MATMTLAVKPGVNAQASKLACHSQWNTSNLVRFKDGFLQKLGGCQHLSATPLVGNCRGLHAWHDLSGITYLGCGTDQRLEVLTLAGLTDITPIRATTTPTNPFATTIHSTSVVVTDTAHGAHAGDWIDISGGSAVGGLTLSGFYQVQSPVTTNTYVITAASQASSGATGGGTPTIKYLIASAVAAAPMNYGAGIYGAGNYGQGQASAISQTLRQWSLDNWGQDLVGCPTNGPPYVWTPPVAANNVATLITGTGVPLYLTGLFVAMPERQVMGFGAETGGVQDPLLIRFSDVNDFTDWTVSTTNQAGSFRLSSGSKIVGALQSGQSALFLTDIELWVGQYLGFPLVWGFNKVGTGCGLIGMRAVGQLINLVLWMGQSSFFAWNGSSVEPLPCPVWDEAFVNLDRSYANAIVTAPNSWFTEMTWYFPTIGSNGIPTSYVKTNLLDHSWDYGTLTRVAWIDQSVLGAPIGVDGNGLIQQHEIAADLDGVAMDSWAETGWFDISSGTLAVFMERFLPDLIMSSGATILVTIKVVDFVGDPPRVYGPYSITSDNPYVIVRARGRFAAVRIESQDLGSSWRLGEFLYVTAPAGRRMG